MITRITFKGFTVEIEAFDGDWTAFVSRGSYGASLDCALMTGELSDGDRHMALTPGQLDLLASNLEKIEKIGDDMALASARRMRRA